MTGFLAASRWPTYLHWRRVERVEPCTSRPAQKVIADGVPAATTLDAGV